MDVKVIAVNAAFSEFPADVQDLIKQSGMPILGASKISADSRALAGASLVIFSKKGLGRPKADELDDMLVFANGAEKREVFGSDAFAQEIRKALQPKEEPKSAPESPLPASRRVLTVKLPSPGEKWTLGDFVRNNANLSHPTVEGEVSRLVELAHNNGFPNASHGGVAGFFRKFRVEAGLQLRKKRGRPRSSEVTASINMEISESPFVTEFLRSLQQVMASAPAFVNALLDERKKNREAVEASKKRILELESELGSAIEASKLLATLREKYS